jgi:DNA polymerase III alpha subunit
VGAFDGFGLTRPELLFLLDGIYNNINGPEARLFFNKTNLENFHLHPGLSDYTFMEKCLKELYMLGFMLSANIVDILDLHPASKHAIPAKNIYRYKGKRIKVFGRKITERSHLVQKSRRIMKFLTIEDKTECIDVIFWPKKYDNFADEILRSGPFEIWGTVSEDSGTYTLEADSIRSVEWFPGSVDFNLASERLALSLKKNYTYDNIPIAKAG